MEGDRIAVLTVEAALRGIIDFREARLLDHKWWRRTKVLLFALERTMSQPIYASHLQLHLTQLLGDKLAQLFGGAGPETKDAREKLIEALNATMQNIVNVNVPWCRKDTAETKKQRKDEFAKYRQMLIDRTGVDPMDPKYKEWEAAQIAKVDAETAAAREKDPMAVLSDRIRDREQRRKQRLQKR